MKREREREKRISQMNDDIKVDGEIYTSNESQLS
jgi:hypothetical protein